MTTGSHQTSPHEATPMRNGYRDYSAKAFAFDATIAENTGGSAPHSVTAQSKAETYSNFYNSARRCSVISEWMDLFFEFAFGGFAGASVGFHFCKQGVRTYKPHTRAISQRRRYRLVRGMPLIPQTTLKMHFQRMDAAWLLYDKGKI